MSPVASGGFAARTVLLGSRWTLRGGLSARETRLGHDALLDAPVRIIGFDRQDHVARDRALSLLRVSHPHVVRALSIVPVGPLEAVVTEVVEGATAVEQAAAGPGEPAAILEIALGLYDALAWLHEHGVVHGALDDEAVVVRDGSAWIDTPPLWPVTTAPVQDIQGLARVLRGLLAGVAPAGDAPLPLSTPWPLVRSLNELASGRVEDAGTARDLLARVRRRGVVDPEVARPLRRPPWDQPDLRVVEEEPERVVAEPPPPAFREVPAPRPELRVVAGGVNPPPGMVRVEGGPELGAFFVDTTPVTNTMWLAWLEATDATAPPHWLGRRIPTGKEQHPVVGISLGEARAYAAWRGVRLPTEAEWMVTARGRGLDRPFPWGERMCGADTCTCVKMGSEGVTAVGVHPANATREGVLDLLGNVWEWVEGEAPDGRGVALGGSFRHACKTPGAVPRTDLGESSSYLYVGFRCAVSAE